MVNWIWFIEKQVDEWLGLGKEPSEEDIWRVGLALGSPSKKKDYVLSRYNDVFNRYIQKQCWEGLEYKVCIYSWNPRSYKRYFPAALNANGTILWFKEPGQVELVSYPITRAQDLGVRGVTLPKDKDVVEASWRIDGWQINFYYDPLAKKWMASTKYVLHNMRWEKRRLEIADYGEVINPYVETALKIAESNGLLEKFKGYEGWTFTFVLLGPEPAITKPLPPDPDHYEVYKLYAIGARRPDGKLVSIEETSKLLNYEHVPLVDVKDRSPEELINMAENSLEYRSMFLRFSGDDENPVIVEIPSKYYPEAMNIKYFSDPKSLIVLTSEGLGEKALSLVYERLREEAKKLVELYVELEKLVEEKLFNESLRDVVAELGYKNLVGELESAKRKNTPKRFAKKLAAVLSDGKVMQQAVEELNELVEKLKRI